MLLCATLAGKVPATQFKALIGERVRRNSHFAGSGQVSMRLPDMRLKSVRWCAGMPVGR